MQNSKASPGSLDMPQKPSLNTPPGGRKVKAAGSDSDPVSSPNPVNKTPKKDRSPKVVDRQSPRSSAAEKRRPNRASELESQLAQLQEELKKTKDQLTSSESCKKKAQLEAEEAKKQLSALSAELEETQKQLNEISDSEESRVQELRKVSQDRDKAWQSELEAVQKQHSMDSAALTSAMNEIQNLKIQLERVSESEASQARHAESAHGEIQSLRFELTEMLKLVEQLKNQLDDCRESEAQAVDEVSRIQQELEVIKAAEEILRSEQANAMHSYKALVVELEQSKNKASSLEELVTSLQSDLSKISTVKIKENGESNESELLKSELHDLREEADRLRAELEDAEKRYKNEYTESTLQIRNAYELMEKMKSESSQRETELQSKLEESKAEVEDLRRKIIEKENVLETVSSENKGLNRKVEENQTNEIETELESELKKLESVIEDLKSSLLDKETRLQTIIEENEMLKSEIKTRETERNKSNDEALALAEAVRASEREALTKLGHLTEEADKSCRKTARVTEQLDAAQNSNLEMEAELRRLKVQSDQWRKAAEAAAAMLCNGNNGKYVGRTGSLDYHMIGGKLSSAYSEDMDDESPKKKNGNMLKKIGVLLKKGQK